MSREELARLGQSVRIRRGQLGLSQENLADICNLHRTYIGGIERGERNISLITLTRLAKALGIKVSELVEGIDE